MTAKSIIISVIFYFVEVKKTESTSKVKEENLFFHFTPSSQAAKGT